MKRGKSLGAVILAAGSSSRMGSPKALLEVEGETFADRLIARFAPHCLQVAVVLGHGAESIAPRIARAAGCILALNPAPERGQLSSLQCGFRALCPHLDGIFFTPVDLPFVSAETISRMAESFDGAGALVIPRHQGRRGHPVLVHARLIPEFLSPAAARASDIVHAHEAGTLYVDVDDAGVTGDIDTPGDYLRARGGSAS